MHSPDNIGSGGSTDDAALEDAIGQLWRIANGALSKLLHTFAFKCPGEFAASVLHSFEAHLIQLDEAVAGEAFLTHLSSSAPARRTWVEVQSLRENFQQELINRLTSARAAEHVDNAKRHVESARRTLRNFLHDLEDLRGGSSLSFTTNATIMNQGKMNQTTSSSAQSVPVNAGRDVSVRDVYINSFNNTATEALLQKFTKEAKELAAKIDDDDSREVVTKLAKDMADAASSNKRRWYQVSLVGLKEATKALGAIAKPLMSTAKEILDSMKEGAA